MMSFEPDFMNQNYNCVREFIESVDKSNTWQHGMTDAALAANVTVQWCYAAPTDILNSLTMPALTNFRTSNVSAAVFFRCRFLEMLTRSQEKKRTECA